VADFSEPQKRKSGEPQAHRLFSGNFAAPSLGDCRMPTYKPHSAQNCNRSERRPEASARQSCAARVISGKPARRLRAALRLWKAAVDQIEAHTLTTPQRNLLIERVRPVFEAMKAVGIVDPFAIDPASYAATWARFFELMGNWSWQYKRCQPPPRPANTPTPATPEIPDDEQTWRTKAAKGQGPPPRPETAKPRSEAGVKPSAVGLGVPSADGVFCCPIVATNARGGRR
jgi:hypothetical protein